jgi:hypothetical protein
MSDVNSKGSSEHWEVQVQVAAAGETLIIGSDSLQSPKVV